MSYLKPKKNERKIVNIANVLDINLIWVHTIAN